MRQRSAAQRIMGASSETQIPATASPQEATARAGSRAPTPGVVAALKFPGPAQIRVLTAPRKAAEEMAFSEERPDINIAAEGKSLSRSVALMGSDVAKILDGFGVKIINAKEKDSRKEDEIEWVEAKMKGTAPNLGAEDAVSKKEADKQKKLAIILALPGFILNSTEVLRGGQRVLTGSKDTAVVLSRMLCSLPTLIRRKTSSLKFHSSSIMSSISYIGTGYQGLRMVLNRHVVTRGSGGSLQVYDGFGLRQSSAPKLLWYSGYQHPG